MAKLDNNKIALQEARLALVKHQSTMATHKQKESELKQNVAVAQDRVRRGSK